MFVFICFILINIPSSLRAVEILRAPDENVWVQQGDSISLICSTNQKWEWCFWEHTNVANVKKKYQTVQKHTTLDTVDTQIKFTELSNTSCGIQILETDREKHEVSHNTVYKIVCENSHHCLYQASIGIKIIKFNLSLILFLNRENGNAMYPGRTTLMRPPTLMM